MRKSKKGFHFELGVKILNGNRISEPERYLN